MEVVLRLFPYQLSKLRLLASIYNTYRFESDPLLGKKFKPNLNLTFGAKEHSHSFQTVTLGFTDIGFRDDGINSECFAVAIGDSFTEGFIDGENVWVELLEKKTGLDFVNMGVGGYCPIQEVRMLKKYGTPLRPKLVLWAFFQNDISESYRVNKRLREQAEGKGQGVENWLIQHSLACQALQYIGQKINKVQRGGYSSRRPYKDDHLSFFFDMGYAKEEFMSNLQEGWKLTRESLLEAKAICQNIKAKFVIILIPCKEQSYWHIVKGLIKDSENYDIDQLNTLMKNFCEEQGITCLDLTPAFQEHAKKGEQLYYTEDGHWNKEGNHLAAEAILDFLKQQGLLPQGNL
ncbi:MAG TPA: SGNH/GDSL hydrolase family protein [Candidatus Hypogeohydataceae bacterium YC41]